MAKADCTNGKLCKTTSEPHECVECISTADCLNNLICNQTSHTCVSSLGDGGVVDAGSDASVDASVPDAGSPVDAGHVTTDGSFADAEADSGVEANDGTLAGAACSCAIVGERDEHTSYGALFGAAIAASVFAGRRRKRGSTR